MEETKASQLYPRNMSVRELLQFWCLMYPMIRGNVGKDTEKGIFSGYFRNTAYSSFSTMLWRDCDVFSKAGWEDGLRNDESGILGTSPEPSMLDGDPANDEIATNDSGIVCAPNGDYLFAFFSNYPAVPEHVLYLVEAIHQAELAM